MKKMSKIPFHFYKNSIRKLKKCGGDKKREKCKEELINYYESHKVKPFYNESKPLKSSILICDFLIKRNYIIFIFFS